MCASCGCGKPNDQHNDQRHITLEQMQQAAQAANISVMEVAQNVMITAKLAGGETGPMGAPPSNPPMSTSD